VLARYSDSLGIDEPLAMLRSGTTSYYHGGRARSVTSLSNAAGALSQTYTFDFVWQNKPLCLVHSPIRSGSRLGNSIRKQASTSTGLDITIRMQAGPGRGPNDQGTLGEATNLYRYAENSPANYADPYGLFTRKSGRSRGPHSNSGTARLY